MRMSVCVCVKVCRGAAGEIVEPRGWALDSCASCIPCGPLTSKNVLALCACRYVALQTLCNVVHDDTSAVQRHKGTIVDCLKVRCGRGPLPRALAPPHVLLCRAAKMTANIYAILNTYCPLCLPVLVGTVGLLWTSSCV